MLTLLQISQELALHDLEEADSLLDDELVENIVSFSINDFNDEDEDDPISQYAAKVAQANITDKTRTGHIRYVILYYNY